MLYYMQPKLATYYYDDSFLFCFAGMLAGLIAILCIFAYTFGGYFPQVAEMQRTGLPQKPDYFVNREQEQDKIMRSITGSISHRSRIITITGSPGYGKTTLANVCGHRLVSQGIPVRYVDLQHVCTIQGIVVKILYAVGSTVSHPSKEQLSRWAAHRQNGMMVLVLDNVDCFTLSGEGLKKEFSDLIKDFIVNPSLAIYVILTTQYQLGYIDKFQLIALDRLSEAHAKELLLCRNPSLSSNVTTALVNATDGNPLALQILSALLRMPNAPPVSTLMKQLQYDPVEALSPDTVHEKLNLVFKVAIDYLSDADYQCFLAVCQFPGSFDEELALAVLPYLVNETASTCLRHLLARSLLEYNRNTRRYNILPLLKTFVNSTAKQYGIMARKFFPMYIQHLLQTAMKKQSLSEVHLHNYLKANYLGMEYLINGYVKWSDNISDFDTNMDLLQFSLATFNILPLLLPMNVVERFWFSVQNVTWNITCEGFEGHCHEYLETAFEFESLLADYMLSTGRNATVAAARLLGRAQNTVPVGHLQFLIASECVKTVTLLRYLGYVTKCSRNEVMYQKLLKAIMHLALSKNHSSTDVNYTIGVIYFELNEYKLAIEFLNKSLTSNPRIRTLNAAKIMVLACQRSGQHELAMETVTRLTHSLLAQMMLEMETVIQSLHHLDATDLDYDWIAIGLEYEKLVNVTTVMQNRLQDIYSTALDLSVAVNDTTLSLVLLNNATVQLLLVHNVSMSPLNDYYIRHCNAYGESETDPFHMFYCFELGNIVMRHSLVYMQLLLSQTKSLCDIKKAWMKAVMTMNIDTVAHNWLRLVTEGFGRLVSREHALKRINVCQVRTTDSVECRMVRSQVRLLWQLQYELADGLAMFAAHFGMLEQAKEYAEIALEKLPKSSVKKKWKTMVDLQLSLAKIELSLGNYWNAIYILRNCSLTIDNHPMIENVYKATQPSSTWQSHDLTLRFPDGHISVIVYHFYHVFNTSKMLSAVGSSTVGLIRNAGIGITISHLLFVGIVTALWSFAFTVLFILGSALYLAKCVCSCSTDRHERWDRFRLFFFKLTIVMCAFSHVVIFHSYILHFHTTVLLTYLNYM